jgi:hypothetical protein
MFHRVHNVHDRLNYSLITVNAGKYDIRIPFPPSYLSHSSRLLIPHCPGSAAQ